jgi:methylenetetrahydrofolate dehydrogenase (NADP+)/methenyltetrahydrofolate cyclohydrolase
VTATLIDGKAIAQEIQREIALQVAQFQEQTGVTPCLAAVLVGENPASEVYVRNKQRGCGKVGMESQLHRLPADSSTDALLELVERLNQDPQVNGILVQLPLPKGLDEGRVLQAVDPLKDVDAFHPENVGRIVQNRPRFLPCTPHGVQELLIRSKIPIAGAHVVVLGRSDIVGKPIAIMLMQRGAGADATVTVCHSRTRHLAEITRQADILVVAIGQPRLVTAEMVKPGAAVIDVGINRVEGALVGDVDFESVREVAGHITPVPGGVGPLTITMLLANTLHAAGLQQRSR